MSKEERIASAFGEYDGAMNMIIKASDEMFRMLLSNTGHTKEDVLELNDWVDRMKAQARNRLTIAITEIEGCRLEE